jgi:2-polyprenyl-3-methyl-5-hydroxy-6-metoxy-1,4-benzoquinol methylase
MLCGGTDFVQYRAGIYGRDICACARCKLVFTNPQPEPGELLTRYGADYYAHWIKPEQRARRKKLWDRRVKVVKKVFPSGKLLDVGCGEGLFLHCAQKAGYEVAGLEISEFAVAYAKKEFELDIQQNCLENAEFPENSFDIVTLWHTLEHMPHPDITLRKAYQLLKPGGHLIVAVPNLDDIIGQGFYRLMQGHYCQFYTPDSKEPHLYHFTTASLKNLLAKCRFKISSIDADFCQIHPYWRVIEHISYLFSKISGRKAYLAILAVARK